MHSDPIADLLARLRNGANAKHVSVNIPHSTIKIEILKILQAEGYIIERERGTGGFGYDPLFWMPSLARTFGEADPAAKDRLSHRGEAFRAMAEKLKLSYRTGS